MSRSLISGHPERGAGYGEANRGPYSRRPELLSPAGGRNAQGRGWSLEGFFPVVLPLFTAFIASVTLHEKGPQIWRAEEGNRKISEESEQL